MAKNARLKGDQSLEYQAYLQGFHDAVNRRTRSGAFPVFTSEVVTDFYRKGHKEGQTFLHKMNKTSFTLKEGVCDDK